MPQLPKITIVTPSYNQGEYIEETITSILDQGYPNLEYIIMDGGSTDQTVEVIKKYDQHITHWESVQDDGQSHAINKGREMATGDVFNWINSDDYLEPGALQKVGEALTDGTGTTCLIGNIRYVGSVDSPDQRSPEKTIASTLDETLLNITVKQPSTWYRMELVREFGPLTAALHYSMDYEWWIKYLLGQGVGAIKEIPDVLSNFRLQEEAKTWDGWLKFNRDILSIHKSIAGQQSMDHLQPLYTNMELLDGYEYTGKINASKELLERWIINTTIKRYRVVHLEDQFNKARQVATNLKALNVDLAAYPDGPFYKQLAKFPNWTAFRALRKVDNMLGGGSSLFNR